MVVRPLGKQRQPPSLYQSRQLFLFGEVSIEERFASIPFRVKLGLAAGSVKESVPLKGRFRLEESSV